MRAMRHDDGAAIVTPAAVAVTHPEARIHRQRDLNRVVRVGLRAAGVAADPQAAPAPQQNAADAGDRPRRRSGCTCHLRALRQRRRLSWWACVWRSTLPVAIQSMRSAVSFKFETGLLTTTMHSTDPLRSETSTLQESFMNTTSTSSCQCVDCPGASCRCGCQAAATPPTTAVAGAACTCAMRCGCEGAEQGCLCTPLQG